jgi:ribonuclease VapC
LPVIVDTSALIAILIGEQGANALLDALESEPAVLPAPARVEFLRVASGSRMQLAIQAEQLLAEWEDGGLTTVPFDARHAEIASQANARYGSGNGQGGPLNLLDLMVFAVARERGEPLLCTGKDFAATDLTLHAASRPF